MAPLEVARHYGEVADPNADLYQMLHLEPHCRPEQVEEALRHAQRWWNAQQANPKYRHRTRAALARLREAREVLLDPVRRQTYDRQRQAVQQHWRQVRWQPVRELMDVLLLDNTCSHQQEQLLVRFARRRNLTDDEIRILLNEEFLRRDVAREPEPEPLPLSEASSRWREVGHKAVISCLALALVGLSVLPLYNLTSPAILLLVPWLNDVRLLVRSLYLPRPSQEEQPSVNGWDWLAGVAVLGGATATALATMQRHTMLPLGIGVAALIWSAWLLLVILWRPSEATSDTI